MASILPAAPVGNSTHSGHILALSQRIEDKHSQFSGGHLFTEQLSSGGGESNKPTDVVGLGSQGPDIVLQAADSKRFRFSLDILAKYSHFAEGLLSIPPPCDESVTTKGSETPTVPDIELPISSNALSFALECILDVFHSKEVKALPAQHAIDVFTFTDILDCPELFVHILQCAPATDVPSHFLAALLRNDDAAVFDLSPRLLAFSDEYYTGGWWTVVLQNKAPHVLRQLATLFENWNSSFLYFQDKMMPAFPRTVFSHTQFWLPSGSAHTCDQYQKYRGNFNAFHTASIRPLWNSFSTHPLATPLDRNDSATELCQLRPSFNTLPDNVAMLGINCTICRASLVDDVRSVLASWPVVNWNDKRSLGLAVPPSPADMEAWRVQLKPDKASASSHSARVGRSPLMSPEEAEYYQHLFQQIFHERRAEAQAARAAAILNGEISDVESDDLLLTSTQSPPVPPESD